MASNPGLPSTLLLRRGSVESMMSLNSLSGPSSAMLLRRGSVESMTSLHSLNGNGPSSSLWSKTYDDQLTMASNWTMTNDRRSSISGRSMDEMEVVVTSSRNGQVHPFHPFHPHVQPTQPHTISSYENGECDEDDYEEDENEVANGNDSHRFDPRSELTPSKNASPPSFSPSMMVHLSQVEKVTSVSPSKTKSSLGDGYDISTMFQVGPLATPPSPMA
ncbi:hypothetical protein BGZ95_010339 [Linnemannia exigua]|uniref:Uncharacterized protein n=1 Tax=Linnemannia exigua TaxID=604196 RepID=A0AAD4H779_9FUNG|nr:hypothetical protein BGZ95_010339 [Linnemannia exigua]